MFYIPLETYTFDCFSVGETSGKASKGVAKYQAGTQGMVQAQAQAGGACSEIARARMVGRQQ